MKGKHPVTLMRNNKISYLLLSLILGLLAFTISGLVACYVIWKLNNYIMAYLITGGLGALFFSVLLRLKGKIMKITIAGLLAMPVSLFLSFGINEGIAFVLPKIEFIEGLISPDIVMIAMTALFYGFIVGLAGYGKKAMWLFAIVSAVVAIPFGMLVVVLNTSRDIQMILTSISDIFNQLDLNFLCISLALGAGLGMSNGVYNMIVRNNQS